MSLPSLSRIVVAILALACLPARAAPAPVPAPIQTVIVPYVRDPVDKSYRKMLAGLARFERDHALAPAASLRFRLLPRLPTTDMAGVALRIAGERVSVPLALDADHSFVLPRNEQAVREDAAVVANRRADSLTWRAAIHSPGLASGTRRLGDLRLECRVGIEAGLVSNSSPIFGWLSDALSSADQVCNSADGNYLFFTDRPVFGVTVRHGARSEVLPFSMLYAGGRLSASGLRFCDCQVLLDRSYYAPIFDPAWPDDSIVEFDYMDDAPKGAP
ncbi:hypothetical protein [Massilia pseudoviolaceinigra]|uniref:hypothetical protein n=1 Tax=Massilia pseudoviolaceinigra TaxID=3057165 RepID=UPI0027964C07|nr:hypothetical protein [Massilia sp. CCM 9206]MDQ1924862.1 hypothetical protein [Massilia sp. CCM 9206]